MSCPGAHAFCARHAGASGAAAATAATVPAAAVMIATLCAVAPVFAQPCSSTASDQPAVKVEYESDGAAVGIPSALLLTRSGDGALRAADVATDAELWTFRAPEAEAAAASVTGERITHLTVLRFDANHDGTISPRDGDRIWLYFGLKSAGPVYYALDSTHRTPRLLWRADSSTMPGLGNAWSTPTLTRIRIGGARQNGEHLVVMVGGGLPANDAEADAAGNAVAGNHLFMLDAASGRLVWSASAKNAAPANYVSPNMVEPFAARIVAIDFDGDQFADRLYAADVGARVWRFDVWNGRSVDQLVTGGIFASLGAVEPLASTAAPADARRFFNAPDVAYVRPKGEAPYYNLSLGSGDAETLRSPGVQQRFYSLRDYAPFKRLTQPEYDAATPIFDGDLALAPAGVGAKASVAAKGWKLDLPAGEQVLSESITVDGVTLFTTFRADDRSELCGATGTNRVYAVKVENAKAVLDLDGDAQLTDADVSTGLEASSVLGTPSIEIMWPASATGSSDGTPLPTRPGDPESSPASTSTRCHVGTEVLRQCVSPGGVVRTFWKRTTLN